MKTPAMIIGNDFISITLNNKPYTIYKGDARFDNILSIIKRKEWEMLEAAFDTAKTVAKLTDGNICIYEDTVTYKNQPTHNAVASKILEFMKGGYPFQPLVKFLDKLMENPSKNSVDFLYQWIEMYKLPITEDGDFLGYKAVRADFKDKHSGTVDNSLGKIIEMPRNQVSDDRSVACGLGYHLGSLTSYVYAFADEMDNIIIVKVNPRDVVSLPADASQSKMRVCRYEVIEVVGTKDKVKEFDKAYIAPKPDDRVHDYTGDDQAGHINQDDNEDDDYYLNEGEIADIDNTLKELTAAPFGVKVTDAAVTTNSSAIGANKAYELHKAGQIVERNAGEYGVYIIHPQDNKSRSFFRQYSGWQLPESKENVISADKAYQLHKQGVTVNNSTSGRILPKQNFSRSYFRSQSGWKKGN